MPRLLIVATSISLMLLVFRFIWTGTSFYGFLLWNLMLAFVPLLFSVLALQAQKQKNVFRQLVVPVVSVIWLLFYPNAPYIVTDFIHLAPRHGVPVWFDAALIGVFSAAGIVIAYISLWHMLSVVSERFGEKRVVPVMFGVSLLTAIGLYGGRILRWNSWDVIMKPQALAKDAIHLIDGIIRLMVS